MKKIYRSGELPLLPLKKIVFTNGCFDILHPGHLYYLKKARSFGDLLVIGLNSDSSIKKLKGLYRPINDFNFRANMLSYFDFIDYIIEFEEDDPTELIKFIKPNYLVKASDYSIGMIAGADFVQSIGGEIRIIDFLDGYSTSGFIEKVLKTYNNEY